MYNQKSQHLHRSTDSEQGETFSHRAGQSKGLPQVSGGDYQDMADTSPKVAQLLSDLRPETLSSSEPNQRNHNVIQGIFLAESGKEVDEKNIAAIKQVLKTLSKKKHKKDIKLLNQIIKDHNKKSKKNVAAAAAAKVKKLEEKKAEVEIPPLPEGAINRMNGLGMSKSKQTRFARRCFLADLNPQTTLAMFNVSVPAPVQGDEKATIPISTTAQVAGITSFIKGGSVPLSASISVVYDELNASRMNNMGSARLVALMEMGVLIVHANSYRDNTRTAGSVYQFRIPHLGQTIKPEWHVHWGAQNAVLSASFKDSAMAMGEDARVETKPADHQRLRTAFGSLWGSGKNS